MTISIEMLHADAWISEWKWSHDHLHESNLIAKRIYAF